MAGRWSFVAAFAIAWPAVAAPNAALLIVFSAMGLGSKVYSAVASSTMAMGGNFFAFCSAVWLAILFVLDVQRRSSCLQVLLGSVQFIFFMAAAVLRGISYPWASMLLLACCSVLFLGAVRAKIFRKHLSGKDFYGAAGLAYLSCALAAGIVWYVWMAQGGRWWNDDTRTWLVGKNNATYEYIDEISDLPSTSSTSGCDFIFRPLTHETHCREDSLPECLDTEEKAQVEKACKKAEKVWFFQYSAPFGVVVCNALAAAVCYLFRSYAKHDKSRQLKENERQESDDASKVDAAKKGQERKEGEQKRAMETVKQELAARASQDQNRRAGAFLTKEQPAVTMEARANDPERAEGGSIISEGLSCAARMPIPGEQVKCAGGQGEAGVLRPGEIATVVEVSNNGYIKLQNPGGMQTWTNPGPYVFVEGADKLANGSPGGGALSGSPAKLPDPDNRSFRWAFGDAKDHLFATADWLPYFHWSSWKTREDTMADLEKCKADPLNAARPIDVAEMKGGKKSVKGIAEAIAWVSTYQDRGPTNRTASADERWARNGFKAGDTVEVKSDIVFAGGRTKIPARRTGKVLGIDASNNIRIDFGDLGQHLVSRAFCDNLVVLLAKPKQLSDRSILRRAGENDGDSDIALEATVPRPSQGAAATSPGGTGGQMPVPAPAVISPRPQAGAAEIGLAVPAGTCPGWKTSTIDSMTFWWKEIASGQDAPNVEVRFGEPEKAATFEVGAQVCVRDDQDIGADGAECWFSGVVSEAQGFVQPHRFTKPFSWKHICAPTRALASSLVTGDISDDFAKRQEEKQLKHVLRIVVLVVALCVGGMYCALYVSGASVSLSSAAMGLAAACATGVVGWLYLEVDHDVLQRYVESMEHNQHVAAIMHSDWARAFFVLCMNFFVPFMFCLDMLRKKVRVCTRNTLADEDINCKLTKGGQAVYDVFKAWNLSNIFGKVCLLGMFGIISVMGAKFTFVLFSWLNVVLSDSGIGFSAIVLMVFIIGIAMFMIPIVPGSAVYLFAGVVLGAQGRLDESVGFWAGYVASIVASSIAKLVACTGQYTMGYFAGKNVKVQQFVGVDKVQTRACEMVLKDKRWHGFFPGKVCILVAGPDFPTSVLCGILKLNIPAMLVGTLPVIPVSIAPQCLVGALLVKEVGGVTGIWNMISTGVQGFAAVAQAVATMTFTFFIMKTMEGHHDELAKERPEHKAVVELTQKEQAYRDCYDEVSKWENISVCQKRMILTAMISIMFSGFLILADFVMTDAFVFESFAITDKISEDLNNNALNLVVRPMGVVCLALFVLGALLHYLFGKQLQAQAARQLQSQQ